MDFSFSQPTKLPYAVYTLPSSQLTLSKTEQILADIQHFLRTLSIPETKSLQERKRFLKKASEFYLKNSAMYKRNGSQMPLLVVTNPQKCIAILTQAHENLGHKGELAVFELIRRRFYWPQLRKDVHYHIASCHQCQLRNLKRVELPPTISAPATIFEKIYVDVMFMPPSGGFHFIVAAKDDLTGTTEARALRHNNSQSLTKFFWEQIYCRYGAIGQVVTDNGPEVHGAFKNLVTRMGIPQVHISPYNKHANGVVERGHFILREAIVKSSEKDQLGRIKNWHKQLELAVFADRVTVSSVTGFSPYYLLHGVHPLLPFDLLEATFMVDGFRSGLTTEELLVLRIRQLQKHEDDLEHAAEVLKRSRLRSRAQFNQRFARRLQKSDHQPGDLVLVRNSRLEMTVSKFKTEPRYLGPYEVVRKTKGGSYILKELDGAVHAQPYAAFRLLQYVHRTDPRLRRLDKDQDPANQDDLNLDSTTSDDALLSDSSVRSNHGNLLDQDIEMTDP